jgi:hypothetical protein
MIGAVSALLLLAAAPAPAPAGQAEPEVYDQRHFTCPVGGKSFTQDVGYSALPFVTFSDGSYLGDEHIDAQIPVCPDNGLVILPDYRAMEAPGTDRMIYADYSPAELARLPALIADPAYAALKPDGRHIQALWLATRLGRPALYRFILLQRATWAATDPGLRRRLVARLAEEGPALIEAAGLPDRSRRHSTYFIVNALRELGRFDEALALLEKVESQGPPVLAPLDPDNTYGADYYAPLMRKVIAERDMDRFPVRLMPAKWERAVCNEAEELPPPYGPRTAATRTACARLAAERARESAEYQADLKEAKRLRRDPAALDRACAATPEARRSGGLASACNSLAFERDSAAADLLVRDGPRLAAACEATPAGQWEGALKYGCSSYTSAVIGALEQALAEGDAAYLILCPGGADAYLHDRDLTVSLACKGAAESRYEKLIDSMLADPVALDAKCAGIDEQEQSDLANACAQRAGDLEQAEGERIAGDDTAFAEKCGRFRRELSKLDDFGLEDTSDELRFCRIVKNLRERRNSPASLDAALADGIDDDTSSLSIEARARAAAIIARAKAEGTYPKVSSDDP